MAIQQKAEVNKELESYKKDLQKELESYKQELKMEVEKYRSKAEKFNFVTKIQFETEFKAYQEIFEQLYDADIHTRNLFPNFIIPPADEEKRMGDYNERAKLQCKAIELFHKTMERHAPFINVEIYKKLSIIFSLTYDIWVTADKIIYNPLGTNELEANSTNVSKCIKLQQAVKEISTDVRNYLATLKVQD